MKKLISLIRDGVIEEWMGRFAIVMVVIPVIINIINRSFFNFYSISIESIALFAYVWIGYGFFGYLYKTDGHVDVKFVENMLPPAAKKGLELFRDLFIFVFSAYMTYWGLKLCKGNMNRMVIGTKLPLVIAYSSIAFGFFSGTVRSFFKLIGRFRKKSEQEEVAEQ